MSTFGTVLAYCLRMYDTIRVLSAGLSLHTWAIDRLVYVLLCDIGWAKSALSISLSLCTFGGRFWFVLLGELGLKGGLVPRFRC